ncbi:MAG: OmpA family protein [Ignavibacteria bacterium]|nr:OmpA family protein [Ignavibacteria bacterium]
MKILRKQINFLVLLFLFKQQVLSHDNIQWASYVVSFSSQLGNREYSAEQSLGKPNVLPTFGFTPCAWAPRNIRTKEGEYLHLGFSKPQFVRTLILNLNNSDDCITQIFFLDEKNNRYLVFKKQVFAQYKVKGKLVKIVIEKTLYKIKSVLIYFKTSFLNDYLQVDCVGISEYDESDFQIKINEAIVSKDEIKEPRNLGPKINSPYQELAPVVTPDGKRIYFTREGHPSNIGNAKRQDIWFSEVASNFDFTQAEILKAPINNEYHNFAFGTTPDGLSLILGNVYLPSGKMKEGVSISRFNGIEWEFPNEIVVNGFENLNERTAYFLAYNGQILLLSLEGKDSYGGLDLYVSFLQDDGTFSKPMNLGKDINTAGDETSPFLAFDDETLYFSSSGFPGYGSLDIFLTHRLDSTWQKWSTPINLGKFVNSEGWDAYFSIPASGEYAYFISTKNSYGREDIFRVELPKSLQPKPVVIVYGKVLNKKNDTPISAKIQYEILPEGKIIGITESNPLTGNYKIVLPGGFRYGFLAKADGFMSISENIDIKKDYFYQEIRRDLYLVPLEVGESITLNNIFFNYNDYVLLEDSYPELNRLLKLMKENEGIEVEISGHTDNIGSPAYNYNLSLQRSRSVANYLISKGINPRRIIIKGYGEMFPIDSNDTEEGRQKNRRVEFKILKR